MLIKLVCGIFLPQSEYLLGGKRVMGKHIHLLPLLERECAVYLFTYTIYNTH